MRRFLLNHTPMWARRKLAAGYIRAMTWTYKADDGAPVAFNAEDAEFVRRVARWAEGANV